MRNVTVKVEGKKVIVEIDASAAGILSGTGKSAVVATTNGNQAIAVGNTVFKLGLNFYRAPTAAELKG